MKRPHISDHVIVCYLERVAGIDLDFVRDAIAEVTGPAVRAGARNITKDGFVYELSPDGVVKTVVDAPSAVQARLTANCRRGITLRVKDRGRRGRPVAAYDEEDGE